MEYTNHLETSVNELKSIHDQRLNVLEENIHNHHNLEQKMDELTTRMNKMEISKDRPMLDGEEGIYGEQKAAFMDYLRSGKESKLLELESKGLTSQSDKDLGYTIPRMIHHHIQQALGTFCPMRQLSNVMGISTDALDVLVEKESASVGWSAENGEREETKTPELQRLRIPVHEMYAKPRATQRLLDDMTMNIEDWLATRIAEKMAMTENNAFINGDGNNKPRGFLNYAEKGEIKVFEANLDSFNDENKSLDVFINVIHDLNPIFLNGASWMMSRSALAAIRQLRDKNGQYGALDSFVFNQQNNQGYFLGYPVILTDDMPSLVGKGACMPFAFGNFRHAYQIVDRAGIHMLRDPYSAKPHVEFYTVKRVGGAVVDPSALRVIKLV